MRSCPMPRMVDLHASQKVDGPPDLNTKKPSGRLRLSARSSWANRGRGVGVTRFFGHMGGVGVG